MTGFRMCDKCNGRGFLRTGEFHNRAFPRCGACEGIGQQYLMKMDEPLDDGGRADEPTEVLF